jgi:hypothetical protein
MIAGMTDIQVADRCDSLWAYAKSSGHPSYSDAFEKWFLTRAKTLYGHTDAEARALWRAALKMHS